MGTAEERLREQLAELKRPPYRGMAGWALAASGLAALGVFVHVISPLPDIHSHMSVLVGLGVVCVAGIEVALWALRRHRESINDREQLITEMRRARQRDEDHALMESVVAAQDRLVRAHGDQAEAVGRLAALIEATMPTSAAARESLADVHTTVKAIHETVAVMQQELPPVEALADLRQRAGEHEQRLEKVEERVDIAYTTGFTDGIGGAQE